MAIKNLIALCLLFAISVHAEAEAEADADAYYGYYNRGGYYGHPGSYYGGHRYLRPSYGYIKHHHQASTYKKPVPYKTYGYKVLNKPVPVSKKPVPRVEPVVKPVEPVVKPEPAPVAPKIEPHDHVKDPLSPYADESILNQFNVVPAVPDDHFGNAEAVPLVEDNIIDNNAAAVNPDFKAAPPQASLPVAYDESPAVDVIAAAPEVVTSEPGGFQIPDNIRTNVAEPQVQQAVLPVAPSIRNNVLASQYHAQDELGNVIYGYNHPNSAKKEQRDYLGNVQGMYSYNDGTGFPKHVSYVADRYGFRVTAANNLPVHRV